MYCFFNLLLPLYVAKMLHASSAKPEVAVFVLILNLERALLWAARKTLSLDFEDENQDGKRRISRLV
jgi:hypothetical protein